MAERGAPTAEQGQVAIGGVTPWRAFYVDQSEYVPELQWPLSRDVYDRMMTDAKASGLLRSVELPVGARAFALEPNGADEESVTLLADDLNLPIVGTDEAEPTIVSRRRNRFNFKSHLPIALKALAYGHYYFEQVGEVDDAGRWRLRKLAARPPRTIEEINVAPDGSLEGIKVPSSSGVNSTTDLSVDRLVAYVWGYEAGNWAGTSMLRSCYKNWLIKDRLLRVDAIKHERSGMGIPMAEAPPGASPEDIERLGEMMRKMKVTEGGGGAVPAGTKPVLMGTSGSLPDTVASIRLQNDEMNSAFLAMFQSLGQGQSGGAYALGKVDYDFFGLMLDAVEEFIRTIFNQHVIEDWYDWNYGEDSQPALLVVEEEPDPIEQTQLVQDGLDESDDAAEDELDDFEAQARAKLRRDRSAKQRRRRSKGATAAVSVESPSLPLPPRTLRRQPYAHEVQAQTDFAMMDAQLTSGVDRLSGEVRTLQRTQIEFLRDAIVDADGDLAKLARLEPTPVAGDAILAAMQQAADMGIDSASSEAVRQGVQSVKRPGLPDLEDRLAARALAADTHLAKGIGQAAARQSMRLTGEGKAAVEVADAVAAHLRGLSDKYIKEQANGVLTAAMNDGRRATMIRNTPKKVYASELLDENTCESCVSVDGTEYENVDTAATDYPTGGYSECEGFERCRGTLVAVYEND